MGCGSYKNSSPDQEVVSHKFLNSKFLTNLHQNLRFFTQTSSLSLNKCFNFTVPESSEKVFQIQTESLFDASMFGTLDYATQMDEMITDYTYFQSIEGVFYGSVHSVCAPDFCLEIGMIILMISILNQNNLVEIRGVYPFIHCEPKEKNSRKNEIYAAWQEFADGIDKILKKYQKLNFFKVLLKKIENVIKEYEKIDNKNAKKRIKYLKLYKGLIDRFFETIKINLEKIQLVVEFTASNKPRLESIANLAFASNISTAERIVHCCFINQNP